MLGLIVPYHQAGEVARRSLWAIELSWDNSLQIPTPRRSSVCCKLTAPPINIGVLDLQKIATKQWGAPLGRLSNNHEWPAVRLLVACSSTNIYWWTSCISQNMLSLACYTRRVHHRCSNNRWINVMSLRVGFWNIFTTAFRNGKNSIWACACAARVSVDVRPKHASKRTTQRTMQGLSHAATQHGGASEGLSQNTWRPKPPWWVTVENELISSHMQVREMVHSLNQGAYVRATTTKFTPPANYNRTLMQH